jgi:hypothetical protein
MTLAHHVATTSPTNNSTDLHIAAAPGELGKQKDLVTRLGIARMSRWQGISHDMVKMENHDIVKHERDGHDPRYVLPKAVDASSSPMAKLFAMNKENAHFLENKYTINARTTVALGDDTEGGFAVTHADMKSASEALQSHLKPSSPFQHGVDITLQSPNGGTEARGHERETHFNICFHRTPLDKTTLGVQDTTTFDAENTLSLNDCRLAVGENVDEPEAVQGAVLSSEDVGHAVFALDLP